MSGLQAQCPVWGLCRRQPINDSLSSLMFLSFSPSSFLSEINKNIFERLPVPRKRQECNSLPSPNPYPCLPWQPELKGLHQGSQRGPGLALRAWLGEVDHTMALWVPLLSPGRNA
ncbi:unnamed protein product [Pipistrellus nathusii]|uniref:Uncharacterized protein n=1 Tax=Pipistrellus nathusii TaxID=59473 RepID=A0ABN9ZJ12_PIPNA